MFSFAIYPIYIINCLFSFSISILILASKFANFVSLSKAYNLRYYIDFNGQYDETSLDFINVVTRKSSDELVHEIMDSMLKFKIESQQKLALVTPSLNKQIEDISISKEINRKTNSKRELSNVKEDQILF